ncbi:hypothetical protein FHETE_8175 [Fusarium heterosporum]|uniref:Uncharacterized protein n=1 Tax=Fusarium heterosporum TaxID=42747 RepID=A0A8H5T3S9_FUSHE|nr:hypothetical protein FHETE_8175 [Fusarium heterosporum]
MGLLGRMTSSDPSSIPDEPPPSYAESQSKYQKPAAPAPAPPPFQASSSSSQAPRPPTAGPSQASPVPRQFPPAFNLYYLGWPNNSFVLAEHQTQPLYLYSAHSGLTDLPPVLLHSGPDPSYQPLASASFMFMSASFEVELPPVPGSGAPLAREVVEPVGSHGGLGTGYNFTIETGVGGNGPRESFEWRRSSGEAVASLGGHHYGWKLVRLSRGAPGGVNMAFTPGGFTDSRGNEVVAAWTMGSGRSLTKMAHYRFMGTGLTGLLGERWAIMVVITGLALFQRDRRR